MDEEYYLTDNIRLFNDKMEYRRNEIEEFKPILKKIWHHILSEYGWEADLSSIALSYEEHTGARIRPGSNE